MWTPRRILLLLLGLAGFVATYLGYAHLLGGIDGLPELPAEYAAPAPDQIAPPPPDPVSPTVRKLEIAFGPTSPEVQDTLAYKTRIELRERGIVIASGQPVFSQEPSRFVTVSPCSVAFFGKEKLPHLRQPGEVEEVSTFHADKAILEFDREVRSPQDLTGRAKLVGMELLAAPEIPSFDPRRGQIEITNNQRSRDPKQYLVFRTVGPLFYKAAEAARTSPNAPQVWTPSAVEVVDRKNLPRPLGSASVATSAVRADELRGRSAIADILVGVTLPPPTITAEGMRIYLETQGKATAAEKRNATGYSGVKRIELDRKVQMNLWTDGGGGFPGSAPPEAAAEAARKTAALEPPVAVGGLAGGLVDGLAVARRFEDRTLLVIETPGSFRYDFDAGRARFEAAAVAPEAVSNLVTVFRASATGRQDDLSCSELVIDFADPPGPPTAGQPAPRHQRDGLKVKALTATGPHVYLSVESEQLIAQGTELHYVTDPPARRTVTTLRGNPVNAVRERNHLIAGAASIRADVVITSIDPPPGAKDGKKQTAVEVRGPGLLKLFDQQSNDTTLVASWGKSLTQEKEGDGKVELDLLKFEGAGAFEDRRGGMKLTGDSLWLWLAPGGEKSADAKSAKPTPNNALPQRLRAVGHVRSQSPELVIGIDNQPPVDQLTIWFRDIPTPADQVAYELAGPPRPPIDLPPAPPTAEPAVAKDQFVGPPAPPPAEPKKQPVHLAARVIESWVVRYPVSAVKPPGVPPDKPSLKYEMERARCEDRVVVHQDPADPARTPRGLDIAGDRLNLDQSRAGSVMEVTASPIAAVHFEGTSIWGPVVKIDQPANTVAVKGRGVLVMPSQSDPTTGEAPRKPTQLQVFWAKEMLFEGAKARAEFFEEVTAVQLPEKTPAGGVPEPGPAPKVQVSYRPPGEAAAKKADEGTWTRSQVRCHELKVTFDRPVYFNDYKRSAPKTAATDPKTGKPVAEPENPKLKTAQCTPMPEDELARLSPEVAAVARRVLYLEEMFKPDGTYARAQLIDAAQLDLRTEEKEKTQYVFASGPGEVRLLQPGSKDTFGRPAPPQPVPPPGQPAAPEEKPLKLTLVKFTARMTGKEVNKLYQEAVFDDGARVWHVPTDPKLQPIENLTREIVPHRPPPGTIMLACTEKLTVSSSRVNPDAPADQRLTAVGNAEFEDDEHNGYAHTITSTGDVIILDGNGARPARLYGKTGVNNRDFYNARQIKYFKNGTIEAPGSTGGSFIPK